MNDYQCYERWHVTNDDDWNEIEEWLSWITKAFWVMKWKIGYILFTLRWGERSACWHNGWYEFGCPLEDIEIFTISKLWILFAENPCYHLSRFHGCSYDISILVPAVRWFLWPLRAKSIAFGWQSKKMWDKRKWKREKKSFVLFNLVVSF